jgi:ketosteroid isomerase-like protein
MASSTDQNKQVVRHFLEDGIAAGAYQKVLTDTVTDTVTVHLPEPTSRIRGGSLSAIPGEEQGERWLRGRSLLIRLVEEHHDGGLYLRGTTKIEIQHMVAEGEYVAARFILRAITALRKEAYENYYHYLFRLREGKVDEIWEYVDTLYSRRKFVETAE